MDHSKRRILTEDINLIIDTAQYSLRQAVSVRMVFPVPAHSGCPEQRTAKPVVVHCAQKSSENCGIPKIRTKNTPV